MIILTAFGPFGKYTINLSSHIVNKLPYELGRSQIIKKIIPVSWRESIRTYIGLISKLKANPELVILLGIPAKKTIDLENYGWNFKFGDDIDNKINFGPIRMYPLPWIKTILNLNEIYSNLEDKTNISISYFPGFYLCNYLYFWALYLSKKKYPVIFIHFPDKGDITEYMKKFEEILKTIIKIHFSEEL